MKAVIHLQYGSPDVLKIVDLDKPTPKDAESYLHQSQEKTKWQTAPLKRRRKS